MARFSGDRDGVHKGLVTETKEKYRKTCIDCKPKRTTTGILIKSQTTFKKKVMYKSPFSVVCLPGLGQDKRSFGRRTVVKFADTESRIYCRMGDGGRERNPPLGFYIFLAHRDDDDCVILYRVIFYFIKIYR